MKIYIVENDGYPEDRYILGVYSSEGLAEKAIERYQEVAGTSYLNDDFVIREFEVDSKINFYGDKGYHFDKNGRYLGEYDSFSIVTEKFEPYIEKLWAGGYRVHVCVDSYDDDVYLEACEVLEKYLGDKDE